MSAMPVLRHRGASDMPKVVMLMAAKWQAHALVGFRVIDQHTTLHSQGESLKGV